jgi:hypothetical protein
MLTAAPGHFSDIPSRPPDVRFWEQCGKHMLASSFSGFDPKADFHQHFMLQ